MPVPSVSQHAGVNRDTAVPMTVYLEGIRAGLVGASIIALWFLIVDTIAGRPLYTPTVLGAALFHGGAGLAAPAGICSLIWVRTFLAMVGS